MRIISHSMLELVHLIDSYLLPDYELGLGEINELHDAIQNALRNSNDYLEVDASMTKSGRNEKVFFEPSKFKEGL